MRKLRTSVVVGLAAVGLVATVCSSGPSNKAEAATKAINSTFTGAPIHIGQIVSVNDQSLSDPDPPKASEMAVMDINAHGGINGHKLDLDVCDDQNSATVSAQCAQTLVSGDNDVALVGSSSVVAGGVEYPILQKANKINFAPYPGSPDDAMNPLSFPLVPSVFQVALLSSVMPRSSGPFSTITYTEYQSEIGGLLGGVAAKGYTLKYVTEPTTTVDWTAAATQSVQSSPKYVFTAVGETAVLPVVDALEQAGNTATVAMVDSSAPAAALSQLYSSKAKVLLASSRGTNSALYPMLARYQADLKKYGRSVGIKDTIGQPVINAFAAVILFAQAAKAAGSVSSPAIKTYLNAQTSYKTGFTHNLNFTKAGAMPGLPRIFNTWEVPAVPTATAFRDTSNKWIAFGQ
jgi:branched-chain amino acid transport system substrate-binding protein